jgi:hypothetical protein
MPLNEVIVLQVEEDDSKLTMSVKCIEDDLEGWLVAANELRVVWRDIRARRIARKVNR